VSDVLLLALGLFLVLEGLLPFASPARWRDFARRMSELRDGQLRFVGLLSILLGLGLVLLSELR
jgi:uncharacterized protein YjeT (DUF2065 family)